MKKILFALSILFATTSFVACSDDDDDNDRKIEFGAIPRSSQDFVKTHFGNPNGTINESEIRKVEQKHGGNYEIKLTNGIEIEFYEDGTWKKIDMEGNTLPQSVAMLIDAKVLNYISTTYSNAIIEELEKKGKTLEVELLGYEHDIIFDEDRNLAQDRNKFPSGTGESSNVALDKLPVKAYDFLREHFNLDNISLIKKDSREYEVNFKNGIEVEFDLDGNMKSVETKTDPIPESIILPEIKAYLGANHSTRFVKEYSKILGFLTGEYKNGYEVELRKEKQVNLPELKVYFSATGKHLSTVVDD